MNNIFLIAEKEYKLKIRNKAFLIITLLAPFIYLLIITIPALSIYFAGHSSKNILVVDDSKYFAKIPSSNAINFINTFKSLDSANKDCLKYDSINYVLYIPASIISDSNQQVILSGKKIPETSAIDVIEDIVSTNIQIERLKQYKLSTSILNSLNEKVRIKTQKITLNGKESSSVGAATTAAYLFSFLIYMFIFLYGGMVMKSVQSEKQSRVSEVILSTVKPFDLMMGKILGVAALGITQIIIWVTFSLIITAVAGSLLAGIGDGNVNMMDSSNVQQVSQSQQIFSSILSLPWLKLILFFIFYFISGYFLYSALMSAIASAGDVDADTNQYTLLVTAPIIIGISMLPAVVSNPDNSLSFWLSIIPFTSPIAMMARIPFGVPAWQLILSMVLLILTFIGSVSLSGRIFRVGLLMYGKKVSLKELSKWMFYK